MADSVGTVKTFVQDNRQALVTDVEKLTKVMKTINSERDSIDTALAVAPVAINNLTLAYNAESGTIGSRIGIQGQLWDADGFLCAIVQQSAMPKAQQGPRLHDLQAAARAGREQHPGDPASGKQAGNVDDVGRDDRAAAATAPTGRRRRRDPGCATPPTTTRPWPGCWEVAS